MEGACVLPFELMQNQVKMLTGWTQGCV
jgi:hypothetical protein